MHIFFKSTHEIFQKFDNYEIWTCEIVGKDKSGNFIYETCDFDSPDIAIWCVYGHFVRGLVVGGLECISEHDTLKEAEEFMKALPILPPRL
ncbi:MAG: hypothetical protein HZB50_05545 [Chloroflexi bacterium]|nr:hypothetical protein [Chloroflexota bacterium]